MAETNDDFISSLKGMINSELIDLNTSMDGVVVSYNGGLATVKPVGKKRFQDGDELDFPPIYNVPVRWPSFNGGKCGFKGPIKAGDKVQVIFGQQAKDGTDDQRRFDLSDAYCFPAHNATAAQGGNNEDTILYFGSAYIKLTEDGKMEINAPGGCKTIAPTNEFTGAVTVKGLFTFMNGMIGSTASGVSAVITGAINFIGSLTSNGKNISDSHTHSGVQTGSGTTGGVS